MSNSAGGVMAVVAQGAHKLGLVSIVRAEDSMTQVWHKVGVPVQSRTVLMFEWKPKCSVWFFAAQSKQGKQKRYFEDVE